LGKTTFNEIIFDPTNVCWYLFLQAAQTTGCKEYYSKGMRAPAVESVKDVITVPDGFPLGDIAVTLDVSHRRIGALVVTLTAQPPASTGAASANRTVILKERGLGRLGDNMYMTSFADGSGQSFPVPAVRFFSLQVSHALILLLKYQITNLMHTIISTFTGSCPFPRCIQANPASFFLL
jgi:hypothetical protein